MSVLMCAVFGAFIIVLATFSGATSPTLTNPNSRTGVCDLLNSHCHCTKTTDLPNITCKFDSQLANYSQTLLRGPKRNYTLGKLDVSHSDLSCLADHFLVGVSRLTTVMAQHCGLTRVPQALLLVQRVHELDLSHNNLTHLSLSTLASLQIITLRLDNNCMELLTVTGQRPKKLTILHASHNKLGDLPLVLWQTLHEAHMSNNLLAALPTLPSPSLLTTLDLSNNHLAEFPIHFLTSMAALQKLCLARNNIHMPSTTLPSAMNLTRLTHLDLSGNEVQSMTPGLLANCPHLLVLDLSHNNLTSLHHDHDLFPQHTSSIQTLNFSHNAIMQLHADTFLHLHHLHHLNFSHNPGIGQAGVSHVNIPEHLRTLDLSHCQLEQVDYCQLSRLHDMTFLNLAHNQLQCTCNLHMLFRWFSSSSRAKQAGGESANNWQCVDNKDVVVSVAKWPCTDEIHCLSADPVKDVPDLSVTVNVILAEHNLITSWTVSDISSQVQGFRVLYTQQSVGVGEGVKSAAHVSPILGVALRSYTMTDIKSEQSYTVCVDVLGNETSVFKRVCKTVTDDMPNAVVGIMAGVTFLIPCVVFVIFIFFKDRAVRLRELSYTLVIPSPQGLDQCGNGSNIADYSACPVEGSIQCDVCEFTTDLTAITSNQTCPADTEAHTYRTYTNTGTITDTSVHDADTLDTGHIDTSCDSSMHPPALFTEPMTAFTKGQYLVPSTSQDSDILHTAGNLTSVNENTAPAPSPPLPNSQGEGQPLPSLPSSRGEAQGTSDPLNDLDKLVAELQALMNNEYA